MCKKNNQYYWTCPYCGANLDPGEKCDCDKDNNNETTNNNNYKTVQHGGDENVLRTIRMLR